MKRDPKNSRRPNDGAANLAMLKRTVKKLFSYYPVLAPVTFACILFSAIVTSIPSLFVQNVIQVIEKWYVSRDWVSAKAELIPILSLLISLYVLSIIAILVYKQLMAYMTQGFLDKLRQEMFGGMQDLPIRYFDTHQHGDIMSFYTNDIDTLRQLVSEAIPAFIQSGAIVLAVFGIMLYFSIWLTLISVLGVILMIVVTKRVGGGSAKFFLRQQQAVAKTEGYIQETMTGQKVVKVFCHEQRSIEEFDKINDAKDMYQESGASGNRHEFIEALLRWNRSFLQAHNVGATLRFTQDSRIQTVDLGTDIKNSVSRKNMGLSGQVTYNFKNRYFIDWNFGYTGSENFASGHRWGFFPAYSLAWNVAEEKFVQKVAPWLNMFKIRFSYGKVGTDATGGDRFPYLYTLDYYKQKINVWNFGTTLLPNNFYGIKYTQVASNGVTWEVSKKKDIGIDLVMFNQKLSMTVDYFEDKNTGIYMTRSFLPAITGLESAPRANVGVARKRGFDGNASFHQTFGKDWDLTVRGNITYYKNEVLERDEANNVYAYQNLTGYRVDQERGLIAIGLFKDYDDIRNSPKQNYGTVQPGDIKYKDVNGDGVNDYYFTEGEVASAPAAYKNIAVRVNQDGVGLYAEANPVSGYDLVYKTGAGDRYWYPDGRQYLYPIPAKVIRDYRNAGYTISQNPEWDNE